MSLLFFFLASSSIPMGTPPDVGHEEIVTQALLQLVPTLIATNNKLLLGNSGNLDNLENFGAPDTRFQGMIGEKVADCISLMNW